MTQKTRILKALRELALKGRFFKAVYRTNGTPEDIDPDATPEKPMTCIVNDVKAEFTQDARMGRRVANRRVGWDFKVILHFVGEINSEFFEQDVCDTVTILPQVDSLPDVRLDLTDATYEHPPQQDPGNGSRIEYTFQAVEGRR